MTGQVGSAVVSEITNRTITKVLQIFNIQPTVNEKLDMLCIHIHGVVEASKERRINGKYLLRWQEKLQKAATDGDEVRFSTFSKATRGNNHQNHALAYAKIATPGMFNCLRNAGKLLLSCSEDVHKLNSTLERLEKLSADTQQFWGLIDLEELMTGASGGYMSESIVAKGRASTYQKEEDT